MNTTKTVYGALQKMILSGEFSPSQSLQEQRLAEQFGVSRSTVKKALLLLEREFLVTIEPNKGAKVRAYSLNEVLDFLDVRAHLEGFIVYRAVPVISEDDMEKMEQTLTIMKKYSESRELLLYSQNNRIFHRIINDACPSRVAVEMVSTLKNQMSKYNTRTILVPGRDVQSYKEHEAVFHAIKARDAKSAEALMREHILNVRNVFKENYKLLF